MSAEEPRARRWRGYDLALFGLTLAFAAPLAAFAATGLNMRYSGDDYCYAGLFRQQGYLQTIWNTYAGPSPFHGNRLSLTISSGIADMIGPAASAVLPALVLLVWLIGLVLLLRETASAGGVRLKALEPILAGEALMLVTLLITPQLVQSLYWRSGMFPYLMPLVIYPFIAAIMVRQAKGARASTLSLVGIFVLSLFAGAYSETAAVVQMSLLAIAAIAVTRTVNRSKSSVTAIMVASGAGTLLAIAILAFSPSNESRLATLDQAGSLLELLRLSVYHGYLYMRSVFPQQIAPAMALFAVAFWLAAHSARQSGSRLVSSWRKALIGIASVGVASLLVILASMFPSAYAQSSYPVGRALILAAFAVAFAVAAVGAILGSLLEAQPRRYEKTALRVAGVAAVIAGAYALAGMVSTLDGLDRYQRWARFWDARHSDILSERRAGAAEIEVVLIDHIIPDVAELQPDPNYFYNNCAEWYYDIQSLAANQPGWDE
ncbi:MAG: hypothetical protein BMS9Abin28_1671 [Anaerolineae bacterium]|nr:MAG: hypothetical protein BMS9Abin28_1671 [Anaerolineae bacterium]